MQHKFKKVVTFSISFIRLQRVSYSLFLLILASANLFGQSYTDFTNSFASLYRASSLDSSAKAVFVNQWFSQHHVPLIAEDSVLFLYRGDAKSVAWMGNFNGWTSE